MALSCELEKHSRKDSTKKKKLDQYGSKGYTHWFIIARSSKEVRAMTVVSDANEQRNGHAIRVNNNNTTATKRFRRDYCP